MKYPLTLNLRVAAAVAATLSLTSLGLAGVTGSWISPTDGSTFAVGTLVTPSGQASAFGSTGGTGLDLAIVMDSSGSMGGSRTANGRTQSLAAWQKELVRELVNALPAASTSVAVVEFDSYASLVRVLSPLSSEMDAVISAVNSVDASGGTNIGTGIDVARTELLGPRATASRTSAMVVLSDGESSGSPYARADAAYAAGVDQIHSVGLPGHNVSTMVNISNGLSAADPTDDIGTYTNGTDLSSLIGLFNGTSGNLVGIDHIDVQLPDGSMILHNSLGGLGTFNVDTPFALRPGANQWTLTAWDTTGNSASSTLTIYGGDAAVPEPSSAIALLTAGVCALMLNRRRR